MKNKFLSFLKLTTFLVFILFFIFGFNNNFVMVAEASGPRISVKDVTSNSVTMTASGTLDKNSYTFLLYDSSIFYLKDTDKEMFAIASKKVDLADPTDNGITVNFTGLKLQADSHYVAVLDYERGVGEDRPISPFDLPVDLSSGMDNISVSSVKPTSVELQAKGLSLNNKYVIQVINNPNKTPNTKYDQKVIFTPIYGEDGSILLPELRSFTGLVGGSNYIAILYKNDKSVDRIEFITSKGTNTTPANTASSTKKEVKNSGIVPECNVGEIDKATGQYVVPCDFNYFMRLLNNIIKFLLFTIATPLIALIIMYTGYLYLTSGGNSGQTEKVRHILFNAVIGYVIALSAWLIINTIISAFKIDPSIETFIEKSTLQK